MVTTRAKAGEHKSVSVVKSTASAGVQSQAALFGGCYIPNEVFMLILDVLPIEDRANVAASCSQLRCLALRTLDKLKIMRDLPYCAPAPASITSSGWIRHRVGSPAHNMIRFQNVIVRCSSVITYLNLLGTNILNQDLMAWIYNIEMPLLENIKFPNGTDLYLCLLRDLAATPSKWSRLNQISIGFGSKLEVPEECLELVRIMRHDRPQLKSNIARCRQCHRLYFTDSRVKCLLCGHTICSQHFTRAAGNHCLLSLRTKCPYSGLKHHTTCTGEHNRVGCVSLGPDGRHWPCFKPQVSDAESSLPEISFLYK